MHKLTIGFVMLLHTATFAQSVSTRMGARHAGAGYASFAVRDEAALFNNVAGLASTDYAVALFCHELAADLPGSNRTAAAFVCPTHLGTIAVGAFRFGDKIYNEQNLSLGFGHRIGSTALGVRFNYLQYHADTYGTISTVTVDFSGITELTPELFVGAGIFNLTQSSISQGESLPVILVAAIAYQPHQQLHAAMEVEKRPGLPLIIKSGVDVGISRKIFVRTGVNLNPMALFCGLGAKTRRSNFDFATTFNRHTGIIHQVSISYRPGKFAK